MAKVVCPWCGAVSATEGEEGTFECPSCGKPFKVRAAGIKQVELPRPADKNLPEPVESPIVDAEVLEADSTSTSDEQPRREEPRSEDESKLDESPRPQSYATADRVEFPRPRSRRREDRNFDDDEENGKPASSFSDALACVGCVWGFVSFVLSFLCCFIGVPVSVMGILAGWKGLRSNQHGMAAVGLFCSIMSFLLNFGLSLFFAFVWIQAMNAVPPPAVPVPPAAPKAIIVPSLPTESESGPERAKPPVQPKPVVPEENDADDKKRD